MSPTSPPSSAHVHLPFEWASFGGLSRVSYGFGFHTGSSHFLHNNQASGPSAIFSPPSSQYPCSQANSMPAVDEAHRVGLRRFPTPWRLLSMRGPFWPGTYDGVRPMGPVQREMVPGDSEDGYRGGTRLTGIERLLLARTGHAGPKDKGLYRVST
jgi:hypothetical protein